MSLEIFIFILILIMDESKFFFWKKRSTFTNWSTAILWDAPATLSSHGPSLFLLVEQFFCCSLSDQHCFQWLCVLSSVYALHRLCHCEPMGLDCWGPNSRMSHWQVCSGGEGGISHFRLFTGEGGILMLQTWLFLAERCCITRQQHVKQTKKWKASYDLCSWSSVQDATISLWAFLNVLIMTHRVWLVGKAISSIKLQHFTHFCPEITSRLPFMVNCGDTTSTESNLPLHFMCEKADTG